ncbi:hypothetical protein C0J52_12028 [Blattella germanica]|nr:hypothetical protein C0J52_12028 [Blattella germanica]
MFECGLEGVSLKVVKRSQFEKGENGNDDKVEQTEVETSHTDTVRSRDELESQPTANPTSVSSQVDNAPSSATSKSTKSTVADGTPGATTTVDSSGDPKSGEGPTSTSTPAPSASTAIQHHEDGHGNTSSCVIELRTVWFNFAAPPRAPITRKIDFTR